MENEDQNKMGRPALTQEELDKIVLKLQPHLQAGKTLRKACLLAEIPHSTTYRYYNENEDFRDKIDAQMAYSSNLINNLFFGRLVNITRKDQNLEKLRNDLKEGKIKKEDFEKVQAEYEITDKEWEFIRWYATNTHTTRGEYGQRMELTGEDGQPLIPESPLKEVAGMLQELLKGYGKTNIPADTGDTDTSSQILQE